MTAYRNMIPQTSISPVSTILKRGQKKLQWIDRWSLKKPLFYLQTGLCCSHSSTVLIYLSVTAAAAQIQVAKVFFTFSPQWKAAKRRKIDIKREESGDVLDQRARLQPLKGSLALHLGCPCLPFCPLNTLDILRWRSKAQERREAALWGCKSTV